jgi:hypothetical protein
MLKIQRKQAEKPAFLLSGHSHGNGELPVSYLFCGDSLFQGNDVVSARE